MIRIRGSFCPRISRNILGQFSARHLVQCGVLKLQFNIYLSKYEVGLWSV